MLKIENVETHGIKATIRGMRNPKNSWKLSDSGCGQLPLSNESVYLVGDKDRKLMVDLASNGPVHAKYRRMMVVYLDVTAPLYWWKEFDTYKVGTVANSCSTMHKVHAKKFVMSDFSVEHLEHGKTVGNSISAYDLMSSTIDMLNYYRNLFLDTKNKKYWWQMIQLLPSSYNQKRTIMLNYEVLTNIYESRKGHKLDEWQTFRSWIDTLPLKELIDIKR